MGCEQSSDSKLLLELEKPKSKDKGVTSDLKNQKQEVEILSPIVGVQRLLQEYIRSEERIRNLEQSDPLTLFYIKKSQLIQVERKIQERLKEIQDLKQNSELADQQIADVESTRKIDLLGDTRQISVRNVLIQLGDKALTKGDHRTIVLTSKLEIAMTELEMLYQDKAVNENDVMELFGALSKIREEYRRQFEILDQLGIEEELNVNELIELETRRITISETFERWKEGRTHILEACSHFSRISERLKTLGKQQEESCKKQNFALKEADTIEEQYRIGEEVRDDLVSIWQSLDSVKFYLGRRPYCTDTELATLQKAMMNLFIDLKSEERRRHSQDCYEAFHKRAVALLVWVDKTIETVITPALKEQNDAIYRKATELSRARMQSIQRKYPTLNWNQIQFSNWRSSSYDAINVVGYAKNPETNETDKYNNLKLFELMDADTRKIFTDLELNNLADIPRLERLFEL